LFFLSTMVASSLFSVYSPAFLAGASAGIAGLMGAAIALRPKKTVALAVVVPLFLLFALPLLSQAVGAYTAGLAQEKTALELNVTVLAAANRTAEAAELNRTALAVGEQIKGIETGAEREAVTPSDLMVHVYGAAFGVFYVFFLKKKQFRKGMGELVGLGGQIWSSAKAIKSALAKK